MKPLVVSLLFFVLIAASLGWELASTCSLQFNLKGVPIVWISLLCFFA
jgi:hypothetical protein